MTRRARGAGRALTVLKIGGSLIGADGEAPVLDQIAAAWAAGEEILVVHGGGRELSRWLATLRMKSRFIKGQRVTTPAMLPIALMVLGGLVNRRIVEGLLKRGCPAVGLTGADGEGTRAAPLQRSGLGAVGRIVSVNASFYRDLMAGGRLPVVASLALDRRAGWLNVNADLMAGALAAGLGARRLLLLTDVDGVRDGDGAALSTLSLTGLDRLIASGAARDGMIPKLQACRLALRRRVPEVRIVRGETVELTALLRSRRNASRAAVAGTRVMREPPEAQPRSARAATMSARAATMANGAPKDWR
jgi:acetylglutamate kinase